MLTQNHLENFQVKKKKVRFQNAPTILKNLSEFAELKNSFISGKQHQQNKQNQLFKEFEEII